MRGSCNFLCVVGSCAVSLRVYLSGNSPSKAREPVSSAMSTVLPCVFIFVILSCAQAHSNLADPLPTRGLVCRVGNSQPRDCPGPCPPLDSFGSPTGVNEKNPAATWVRGQSKFVAWQRNNHEGDKEHGTTGFTRLALVPVDKMFSSDAHMQYAFHYACWGAGEHDCPSRDERVCGNDQTGRRYGTTITVPTNYADGVYVLGYSWFGGGDWRASSFFGEYVLLEMRCILFQYFHILGCNP